MSIVRFASAVDTIKVSSYRYTMDGEYTGDLYLLWGYRPQVSWRSQRTGLKTAWHGKWHFGPGDVVHIEFDYEGKDRHKWTQVNEYNGVGRDYRQRRIVMQHIKTWRFDPGAALYVMSS